MRRLAVRHMPAVLGVLGLVAALGCQRGNPDYFGTLEPRHPANELWLNNANEPEWLDPGRLADSAGSALVWNMMSGLVQQHPKTLQAMPDLASRWEISDDGTVYTFTLREGIVWSDGHPITSDDFAWAWRRVLDPATGSKYASFMYVLKNGAAVNQRAVWVTPAEAAERPADFVAGLEQTLGDLPHGAIETTDWPRSGAFVHVPRKHASEDRALTAEERDALRDRLIETLEGAKVRGTTIAARVADTGLVGVRAPDARTVVARLQNPIPYFLDQVSFYTFLPVPRHVLDSLEKQGIPREHWTRPEHIVCSGPYVLSEHKFRQYYLFEKNPLYWDADRVKIERVKTLLVDSYATGLNLYRAGEIDWTGTNASLPSHFMDYLEPFEDFHRDPKLSVYMYWLNTADPALKDPRVRKALSLAIDRRSIVKNVTRAGQIPTADLAPDGLNGYHGLNRATFDPERARELMEEAGYPPGSEMPELTLIYNTSEGHKKIAEAVQQMWKDHLGLEVELANQEWKVFLKTKKLQNFQIARGGWVGDYPDPYTYLELLTSTSGNNDSGWSSDEYDRLLAEANAQNDPERRLELFREAEALMLDEQPIIPVYVYTKSQMVKPYLKGFWGNYMDRHPWRWMWIDERWYDGVPTSEADDPPPPMIPME